MQELPHQSCYWLLQCALLIQPVLWLDDIPQAEHGGEVLLLDKPSIHQFPFLSRVLELNLY